MAINEICARCKKLCKRLDIEDVRNCPKYDPLETGSKNRDSKKTTGPKKVIIKRR